MDTLIIDLINEFRNRLFLYFTIGSTLSIVIYLIFKEKNIKYKILTIPHRWRDMRREIMYSISSLLIFTFLFFFLKWLIDNDYTMVYYDKEVYGIAYYCLSILLVVIIHDIYFYWTHRLLHTRWLMRHVHSVHHRSSDPTIWAAFSFHPLEAVINFGVFYVLVFTIPLHISVFFLFFFINTSNNLLGHCGFEIFPKKFTRHWVGKWFTTSTHHHMHHKFGKGNYALYFTCLDYLFSTVHSKYHTQFDATIVKRNENTENSAE